MSYRWKPSRAQRRAFTKRMEDPKERKAYEERKVAREEKRRASSRFDYPSAGGRYKPTQYQASMACKFLEDMNLTMEQETACNLVYSAYVCNEATHHDNIHVVNELIRNKEGAL